MTILVVEPRKKPYVKEIPHELEAMQNVVDGCIQAVYPWNDPVALICDDDGKQNGKKWNRALRDEDGYVYDIIVGTFFICGLGKEDFCSLPQNLITKYSEMFAKPEAFLRADQGIVVAEVDE